MIKCTEMDTLENLYTNITKKEKREMVEHEKEDNDLQFNPVRSLHNKDLFLSTLKAGR
jgi:hypothetical protein